MLPDSWADNKLQNGGQGQEKVEAQKGYMRRQKQDKLQKNERRNRKTRRLHSTVDEQRSIWVHVWIGCCIAIGYSLSNKQTCNSKLQKNISMVQFWFVSIWTTLCCVLIKCYRVHSTLNWPFNEEARQAAEDGRIWKTRLHFTLDKQRNFWVHVWIGCCIAIGYSHSNKQVSNSKLQKVLAYCNLCVSVWTTLCCMLIKYCWFQGPLVQVYSKLAAVEWDILSFGLILSISDPMSTSTGLP